MTETRDEDLAWARPGAADEPAAGEANDTEKRNGAETSPGEVSPKAATSKPQRQRISSGSGTR